MGDDQREEWVVVAEFTAFDKGSGIPAQRMPTGSITGAFGTGMLPSELIKVIVPPEYEDRARDILAESEQEADNE